MICRGVITLVDDSLKLQSVQVESLADRVHDRVERFQNWGFSSSPPLNTEAICLAVGGDQAHYVVVATDDRATRPKNLLVNQACLYDNNGIKVLLTSAGVEIRDNAGQVNVKVSSTGVDLGDTPTVFVSLSTPCDAGRQDIVDAIKGGVPVATDGGAALQASIAAALTDPVTSSAATEVKAK